MNTSKYIGLLIVVLVFLETWGCAGFGVVATSDPKSKLQNATHLYNEDSRPLLAERLIQEAIEIYSKNNDVIGLGHAYLEYGFFFRSASIKKWEKYYRENGFLEKTTTFDNRYLKSIEYFQKAEVIFRDHEQFDALTNIYYNMAGTYYLMNNIPAVCNSYDKSLEANQENVKRNPSAKVSIPRGVASFSDLIAQSKKYVNCDSAGQTPG